MDDPGSVSVESWFSALPLDDPRCNNDSCDAFSHAHKASQAEISWESQFQYGWWTMWGWAIMIFLAAVVFQVRSFWRSTSRSRDDSSPSFCDKLLALWRGISYRRVPGRFAQYFAWPSLGVLILLTMCTAVLVALSFAQHPYYRGKRGYGSPPLGVRTGLMAFALIPLVIALGGKVNVVTTLTGLGHEKLNVFHRYVGWMCLLLSVIHTIPFIVQPLRAGGPAALAAQYYKPGGLEYTGTPPLGMIVGLATLSIPPIRRAAYELFVHTHILLSVVFLGLCFWHASDLGDSWAYLWATVVIWAASLVARLFAQTSMFSTRSHWLSQCEVSSTTLVDDMIRLDVVAPGKWSWEAGQHFFLRFGRVRPLDNHPFTVANVPRYTASNDTEMVFYVRPQDGLTARIAEIVNEKGARNLRVALDGPYGTIIRPKIATRYDSVILVAGGGGVSAILPWLQELVCDNKTDTSVAKKIVVIWVIRRASAISWVADELQRLSDNAPAGSLEYDIWVTQHGADVGAETPPELGYEEKSIGQVPSSSQSARSSEASSTQPAHVGRRPRMQTLMPTLIGAGRTFVVGCGPESLKVDLSNAVAAAQSKVTAGSAQEIRLHTETFGW